MRFSHHVVGGTCALAVLALFACGTDSSDSPANAGGEAGSAGDDGTGEAGPGGDDAGGHPGDGAGPDVVTFPPAQGDPCRGQPLPTDQHYVPSGMCARLVGSGMGGLRQISFAPNGDLFGVSGGGTIYLLRDADGDGYFEAAEIHTYANAGPNGNNCHVDAANGYLYAGTPDTVRRWAYAPTSTDGGTGEDVVINIPSGGNHPKHTTHVYDGYLYVHSGSSGNASDPSTTDYDTTRSLLKRFPLASIHSGTPLDWSTGEVVTVGLRNMVGYTRNAAGRMFGVVNGLDDIHYQGADVHNDNPGEQVLELGTGRKYGYPFCFTASHVMQGQQVVPAGTQLFNQDFASAHDDAWCAQNSMSPATFVQAHSAPLDITFFDVQPQGAMPEKYRGGGFIALHGSWDRSPATGYKVVFMPFDATTGNPPMPVASSTGTTFPYETVFGGGDTTGPKDGPWAWTASGQGESTRPVGVAISPIDGALYISSDAGGLLYRVGIKK